MLNYNTSFSSYKQSIGHTPILLKAGQPSPYLGKMLPGIANWDFYKKALFLTIRSKVFSIPTEG